MDPTEILEGASPPTDGDTADEAASMVLHNHDLLLGIMLRLGLHTSLVRSILVCKRWSFVASDPFLLRWFRRFHPPRLLGFYVATRSTTTQVLLRPRFVPMPPSPESDQPLPPPPESDEPLPPPPESDQPLPPPPESDEPLPPPPESDQPLPPPPESDQPPPEELAAAVRMAQSYKGLDAYDEDFACICDLQNDTLLVSGFYDKGHQVVEVHWPMSPHRGVFPVPVIPYDQYDGTAGTAGQFLLKVDHGGRDRLVYVWLSVGLPIKGEGDYSVKYKAHIYVLQEDDQWRFRASAAAVLPSAKLSSRPLLVGTNIYLDQSTSIAVLDLKTSSFSTLPLPEGMERFDYKAMILSPAYETGIFLIHLDEDLQLSIWLHMFDRLHIGGGGTQNWLLADAVSLPEMFETLGMTGWTDDGEPATLFQTTQTGDFLEFVFLKLGQCVLCYDTRCRVLLKVHEVTQEDETLDRIHPFMMTWPPKFPAPNGDHLARNVS